MSGLHPLQFVCFCFWLLTFFGSTYGPHGSKIIKVIVEEGSDVMLPCSISTNIESKLFDWMKDGQKEVFLYDAGLHSNNGRPGQDEQFKGRVSHFEDELKSGNASILIRNTTVADNGDYTCEFPHLPPSGRIFHVQLVVAAAPEPIVKILNQTNTWALLQCAVRGASPEPEVEWQDSAGNILHAEEPKIYQRGGRFNIILQTTVNKTDHYHCVVTQKEISHQTRADTFVYISGTSCTASSTGWIVSGVLGGVVLLAVVVWILYKRGRLKEQLRQTETEKERLEEQLQQKDKEPENLQQTETEKERLKVEPLQKETDKNTSCIIS